MLYIENHDHPRIISRYGSEKYWKASGKALAVAYLFQKGTPFLYQGQEIGMLNWKPENADMYEDVQTRWQYENTELDKPEEQRLHRLWRSSRDSARTPVQWDASENAGFTTGTPWFFVNENYKQINVAQQELDPGSILNFYRKAIQLRKSLNVVRHGIYQEHFKLSGDLYAYSMETDEEKLLVVCSFTAKRIRFTAPKGFDLDAGKLLLCNYPKQRVSIMKPYEARVYLWKK